MIEQEIWCKWRILFAQVSFEKGMLDMHSYARIYWCMGKLLIINIDAYLDCMLTKIWLKRWKEAAYERCIDKIQ